MRALYFSLSMLWLCLVLPFGHALEFKNNQNWFAAKNWEVKGISQAECKDQGAWLSNVAIAETSDKAIGMCKEKNYANCKESSRKFLWKEESKVCVFTLYFLGELAGTPPVGKARDVQLKCSKDMKKLLSSLGADYSSFVSTWDQNPQHELMEKWFLCHPNYEVTAGSLGGSKFEGQTLSLSFFFHEATHALSTRMQSIDWTDRKADVVVPPGTREFKFYRASGEQNIPYIAGTVANGEARAELLKLPALATLTTHYFYEGSKNDFYANLDEWNAYLAQTDFEVRLKEKVKCGKAAFNFAASAVNWPAALDRYLSVQKAKNAKKYRELKAEPKLVAFVRKLLDETSTVDARTKNLPCLRNELLEALKLFSESSAKLLAHFGEQPAS